MKRFNSVNYDIHKKDISKSMNSIPVQLEDYRLCRDDLIIKYMPLVEHLARKFATSERACGILSPLDLLQEGYVGLIRAVDRINVSLLVDSNDPQKTIKAFLSKRIKGAIRRAININRGAIKIPEHVLNSLTNLDLIDGEYDPKVAMFFAQQFIQSDAWEDWSTTDQEKPNPFDVADDAPKYNIDIINKYLLGIMRKYLTQTQYDILRLSYGLDVPKLSAIDIAGFLCMNMTTAAVRVSQIKRDAIQVLILNTKPEEIIDLISED